MTDRPDYAEIIRRLEGASGPDREIDVLVWAIANGHELEWQGTTLTAGEAGVIGWKDPGVHRTNFYTNRRETGPGSIPAYTASLDASLALVGERLADHRVGVMVEDRHKDGSITWGAWVDNRNPETEIQFSSHPPLAVLLALFRYS